MLRDGNSPSKLELEKEYRVVAMRSYRAIGTRGSLALAVTLLLTSACTVNSESSNASDKQPSLPGVGKECLRPPVIPKGFTWASLHVRGSKDVKEAIVSLKLVGDAPGGTDPRDLPSGTGYPVPWCMVVVYKPSVHVAVNLYAQVPKRYQNGIVYCQILNNLGQNVWDKASQGDGHVTCKYTLGG